MLLLVAAMAAHAALLTPNMDDGVNASHIANSAAGRWFVNDVFGTPFPFQKLQTVLAALLWRIWPATFWPLATFQGILVLASCLLFYATARRTAPLPTARTATALLATYLLTHNWLAPTRPEMVLLTVGLAVLGLCQRFDHQPRPVYLLVAAALVGLVAVSTHPNAAVVLAFLLLFLLARRRRIGGRTLRLVAAVLLVASVMGLATVFAPDPAGTLRFLAKIRGDGERFSFVLGEAYRFSFLFRFLHYRYLSLLLLGVALARFTAGPLRTVLAEARATLGLFGLWAVAVFATFAVFPAARWSAYVVLHLPWFALAAAGQWHGAPPQGWRRALPFALLAAASLGTVAINASARLPDLFDLAKYACLLLPPLVAALLWARGSVRALWPVLALAFAFKLGLAAADLRAAQGAADFLRQHRLPAVVDAALVWTPGVVVHSLRVPANTLSPPPRLALVAAAEQPLLERWLAASSCRVSAFGALAEPLPARFISPWYRGLTWYELACAPPEAHPGSATLPTTPSRPASPP
ncbi:MAG: glycosyltransferase family 39 protein [Thermoanaerobaculaceae bacterium]|nr:glycosyltransferase family 39 protein [Thermoanaerobaculaceae bacterium]